jgi:hypothetical protein
LKGGVLEILRCGGYFVRLGEDNIFLSNGEVIRKFFLTGWIPRSAVLAMPESSMNASRCLA